MDAQELRNLQEAYMEVVENQQLDELSVNKMHAYINKAEKDRDRLNKKWDQGTATPKERKKVFDREEGEARASKKIRQKTGKDSFRLNALDKLKSAITKEEVDIYDIILSHLLDEGYAETPEAAEAIMVNMSEEWRQSIVEEMLDEELQGKAREKGEELLKKTKGKPNSFQKNSRINWLLGKSKKHPSHEYGTVSRSAEEKGQSRAPKQTKARKGQTKKQGVKTLGGGGGNVGSYGMPQKDTLPRGKGNKAARRAGTYRED